MLQDDEWRIWLESLFSMALWRMRGGTSILPGHMRGWQPVESVTHEFPSDKPEVRNLRLEQPNPSSQLANTSNRTSKPGGSYWRLLRSSDEKWDDPAHHHSPEISGWLVRSWLQARRLRRDWPRTSR